MQPRGNCSPKLSSLWGSIACSTKCPRQRCQSCLSVSPHTGREMGMRVLFQWTLLLGGDPLARHTRDTIASASHLTLEERKGESCFNFPEKSSFFCILIMSIYLSGYLQRSEYLHWYTSCWKTSLSQNYLQLLREILLIYIGTRWVYTYNNLIFLFFIIKVSCV